MGNQQTSDKSARALAAVGRMGVLAAMLMLGACAQVGDIGLGAGIEPPVDKLAAASPPANELEKATQYWSKEVAKNPRDPKATLNYARNLKALGRKPEALAVLQANYLFGSTDRDYLSEYGRLSLEMGQIGTAGRLLEAADDPSKPDWRIVSARGTVLAKQGDYKGAIAMFERADKLAPEQVSIKNNLALAYTMDGQAPRAEQLLREARVKAGDDPRLRQSLALVLGLQGKHDEAKSIKDGTALAAPVVADAPVVGTPLAPPTATRTPVLAAGAPPKATPAVAKARPAANPDDVIRAAIEADMARTRAAARPLATGSVPQPKPATKPKAPAKAKPVVEDGEPALRSTR